MKMMKTKKILSVLLSVIMLLGIVPVSMLTASASDDVFTYDISDNEATITSCEISATGDIVVPSSYNGYPVTEIDLFAFLNCAKIKSVYVPDSVKKIGNKAFSGCTLLEKVSLGKGVEKLGNEIFLNCDSLEEITVSADNSVYSSDSAGVLYNKDKTELLFYPVANELTVYSVAEKIAIIPDSTFSMSKNVKSVILGDNVKEIGNNAFFGSRSLETVKIGKGVEKIGAQAFNWCEKLTTITVEKGNSVYESDSDGVLYNKGKTEILKYPENNAKTAFIVPSGIKAIRTHAFLNSENIKNVSIPKSVELIETSAFSGCTSIIEVDYDGSEAEWNKISIGSDNNAIKNAKINFAGGTSHTHTYTETSSTPATCKATGSKTLKCECGDTKTETIPVTGHDFKDNVCSYCNIQEFILLTNSQNAKITGYNGNGGAVVIPATIQNYKVTAIGDFAFDSKTEITSITLPEGIEDIGSCAFYNTGYYNTASNWKDDVLYIGKYLIVAKDSLGASYTVKEGTELIADYAFAAAKNLKSVTLPKEIKIIGDSAFSGCKITSVTVDVTEEEWKENVIIGTGNDDFKAATFTYRAHEHSFVVKEDEGVAATCLAEGKKISICKCGERKEEVIPAKGHIFADNKCTGCGERQFNISIVDDKVTVNGCHASLTGTVTIPAIISGYKVAAIGDNAFAENKNIKKIILPAGIEAIGEMAFAGSDIIVEFAGANEKYTVADGILYNKNKTELVYCPVSKATKEFTILSGVIAISAGAFRNATVIEKITIPATVKSIGKDVFSGCTGIKNVVFAGTKTQWSKVNIAEGNDALLKAIFAYTDTSDIEDAKALAENLVVIGGKASTDETVIVIKAENEETKTISILKVAADGKTEVAIKTADTAIETYSNNYALAFEGWHKTGNKTETEITVDGNTFEIRFIFPVDADGGHIYDDENPESFDATCTLNGGVKIHCTICDSFKVKYDDGKPATGHSFGEWKITKPKTCTVNGEMERACKVCGTTEKDVVYATGIHKYTETVTEPTCTEKGYTTYSCTTCDKTYTDKETAAKGHDYDVNVTTAPECEKAGVSTYTCKVCGDSKTEAVTATGHRFEGKVVPPTYGEKGYTIYTCQNPGCEASYKDSYVDALGKIISVKIDDVSLTKNDKHTISPTIEGIGSPEWTATYVVNDESIITIDNNGVITAKTRGTAQVNYIIEDEEGNTFTGTFSVVVEFTVWQWIEWFFVDLIYGGLKDFFSSLI